MQTERENGDGGEVLQHYVALADFTASGCQEVRLLVKEQCSANGNSKA